MHAHTHTYTHTHTHTHTHKEHCAYNGIITSYSTAGGLNGYGLLGESG